MSIETFACKQTEQLFCQQRAAKLPGNIQRRALQKLLMLDAAVDLRDLQSPPANRLKKLSGERVGQRSIRINDQWRICFRWRGNRAYEVEITDYH